MTKTDTCERKHQNLGDEPQPRQKRGIDLAASAGRQRPSRQNSTANPLPRPGPQTSGSGRPAPPKEHPEALCARLRPLPHKPPAAPNQRPRRMQFLSPYPSPHEPMASLLELSTPLAIMFSKNTAPQS